MVQSLSTEEERDQENLRLYDLKIQLHRLAKTCGCRPSSLFDWNDPDEWYERLFFDLEIINITWEELNSNDNIRE